VWAKEGAQVPSALLFRAGGANSVRGYDYQSLGLPGPNGSVLGLSLIHISEPTRLRQLSRMPSSA
ncbi:hypothetical protein, partial [Chromobacterium sp. ASV23]|uniref:hypothetical protein n=1 Tax=Chromobacterium sp. ASV23 TaxID=2795110 RepID=UPI001E4EF8BC